MNELDWNVSGEDEDLSEMFDEGDIDEVGAVKQLLRLRPGSTVRPQVLAAGLRGVLKATKKAVAAKKMRAVRQAAYAGDIPAIFLGFDSNNVVAGGIAAGATSVIPIESNVPLRVIDLILEGANAAAFLIANINISRLSLFASGDPLPGDAFQTGVQRPPIDAPVLPGGVNATISITNQTGAPRRCVGMFVGIDLTKGGEQYRQ